MYLLDLLVGFWKIKLGINLNNYYPHHIIGTEVKLSFYGISKSDRNSDV